VHEALLGPPRQRVLGEGELEVEDGAERGQPSPGAIEASEVGVENSTPFGERSVTRSVLFVVTLSKVRIELS